MNTRMSRAAVPAAVVGLVAAVVGLAPAAHAFPATTVLFDVGCSGSVLGRGEPLVTDPPSDTRVFLHGQQSGLTPGDVYTFLWQGPGPTGHATLGTADAQGVITISYLELDLTGPLASSAPAPYVIHDATTGATTRSGDTVFQIRSAAACSVLTTLSVIRTLDPSGNNAFNLRQQGDGNAVESTGQGRVLWASGTAGHPGAHTVIQSDGNLVIRDAAGRAIWNTGTAGHPNATVTLQTDDNVVLRDASGHALWSSGIH